VRIHDHSPIYDATKRDLVAPSAPISTILGAWLAMTFQAYLDNIKARTGETPESLYRLAVKRGVYSPDMKAGQLVVWLKKDFDLGQGHSMAIWAVWKDKGWVHAPSTKK
jgi:Domain of unknown function (DUF4287)